MKLKFCGRAAAKNRHKKIRSARLVALRIFFCWFIIHEHESTEIRKPHLLPKKPFS